MLPQLRMRFRLGGALPPERRLPTGYELRGATDRDAEALDRLQTGAFGDLWRPGKAESDLLHASDVRQVFLVETHGEIVATASYQLIPDQPASGWVHWVGADANHRGLGLGYVATRAVIEAAAADGKADVGLTTDDFRLAAIRVYRSLGFEPDPWHPSHPDRWMAISSALE